MQVVVPFGVKSTERRRLVDVIAMAAGAMPKYFPTKARHTR
ncbi:hypothetical protein ACFPGO_08320 [Arcanobacterium canis]|uniref:Uncharacterized protein n=1 Tax=Arcanobacterium canis TaxID=999183 RepID=A0ABY8FYB9_9ACTO|nr:hypothetical protein [Arcanobacterium canis]WFM83237.1 hypothetical protein P7079_07560 [Arcanobacterium canis]